jgi:hypothetical protein
MTIPPELIGSFWKGVSEILNAILAMILVGAIPFAAIWLKTWFAAKTAEANARIEALKNKDKREAVDDALMRLDKTAATVVYEMDQTKLVRDVATGKVIKPNELKMEAAKKIISRLPIDAVENINSFYPANALVRLVSSKIEEKALGLKMQRAGQSSFACGTDR